VQVAEFRLGVTRPGAGLLAAARAVPWQTSSCVYTVNLARRRARLATVTQA
jgi:hypothetical protein